VIGQNDIILYKTVYEKIEKNERQRKNYNLDDITEGRRGEHQGTYTK
jgi:hypothetical protein